jgi:N-acetylmuramoyl-L-alanine amidase
LAICPTVREGHGVRGPSGLMEKDVTLALARACAARFAGRAKTVLTREADTNPSMAQRARTTAQNNADVRLSIHVNGADSRTRGSEVYVHERANQTSWDLAGRLANALSSRGRPQRGLFRAPLAVLHPQRLGGRVAACLVEVDYLTHPEVERRFGSPAELEAVAEQISLGVMEHLQSRPSTRGPSTRSLGYRYGRDGSPTMSGMPDAFRSRTRWT